MLPLQAFGFDTSESIRSTQPTPVIGVGHSIGAMVTLRAALRNPGKFRALVLIDPVLYVPRFMLISYIVRMLGLAEKLHPLIVGTKKRRRTFDDLEILFRGYRNRNIFRYMSDENLEGKRWWIAVGAIIMQLCLGTVYAWSVFKKPFMTAHG